jgi:hypothetical protein
LELIIMIADIEAVGAMDALPELVPVAEADTLALPPAGAPSVGDIELGDLLSDALFGEVIDISDLIPQVLTPTWASEIAPAEAAEVSLAVGGEIPAATDHTAGLTILYDDDILASSTNF